MIDAGARPTPDLREVLGHSVLSVTAGATSESKRRAVQSLRFGNSESLTHIGQHPVAAARVSNYESERIGSV